MDQASQRVRRVTRSSRKAVAPPDRRAGPPDRQAAPPRLIRLNKFLSLAGVASRRKADDLLISGVVTVNGKRVSELGSKVNPSSDRVFVSGKQVVLLDRHIYIILNKPKDSITTTKDEKGRRTVLDLVRIKERVYPVGRLDRNTTGALILTNDGELANRLMHPRYEVKKAYEVELDRELSGESLKALRGGVSLAGERTSPAEVYVLTRTSRRRVGIIIHEGKNRQVRRMFEACGYDVKKLHRVSDGPITIEGLARGEWRFLLKREVAALKQHVGLS